MGGPKICVTGVRLHEFIHRRPRHGPGGIASLACDVVTSTGTRTLNGNHATVAFHRHIEQADSLRVHDASGDGSGSFTVPSIGAAIEARVPDSY